MISIEITEEVTNYSELENLLEEVLRRVRNRTRTSYEPDFSVTGEEEPAEEDQEQEIIKFTLTGDPQTYYAIGQEYMQDYGSDEGKEVENWSIELTGLPPAAVGIATNIYIDYGVQK